MRSFALAAVMAACVWLTPSQADTKEPPLAPALIQMPPIFEAAPDSPPSPGVVPTLSPDVFCVISSDSPVIVLSSPPGLLKAGDPETGPVKIRGRFIEQPDKVQTKTFSKKYVYQVEPIQSGRAEMIAIPMGVQAEKDIGRRVLEVAAAGPAPDPVPDDSTVPAAIKAAYAKEPSPYKHSYAQMLAGFYRTRCPQYAKTAQTWGEFSQSMKIGRQSLLDNELLLVRQALEQEIFKVWPTDASKSVDARVATDALNAAANALEKLR